MELEKSLTVIAEAIEAHAEAINNLADAISKNELVKPQIGGPRPGGGGTEK